MTRTPAALAAPLAALAAAAVLSGVALSTPAVDTACVDAGANLYATTGPDGRVDVAGYGLPGLDLAHARGRTVVYRQCTGPVWVRVPAVAGVR